VNVRLCLGAIGEELASQNIIDNKDLGVLAANAFYKR
jgi:hypothetical protein